MLTKERESDLKKLIAKCEKCVQVGRPTPSRKVSPVRVVAEFNQTVHIDFMFITIRDTALILLQIVDSATAFSVACIVPSRDLSHAASQFEENWICIHGAPSSVAADPEFARVNSRTSSTSTTSCLLKGQPVVIKRLGAWNGRMECFAQSSIV
jgi:hypothetical protein